MSNIVAIYGCLDRIFFHLASSLMTFTFICTLRRDVGLPNVAAIENDVPFVVPSDTEDDEFYRLLERDSYVDKTLMVNDFLRKGGTICRILRPRGWGKTINLKMLKRFLELEVDSSGEPLAKANRTNARLFDGSGIIRLPGRSAVDGSRRTKRLKALKISRLKEIMDVQGECPVIYISLKYVCGSLYDEIESKLKSLLVDLFDRYRYLKPKLKHDDREMFFRLHTRLSPTAELQLGPKFLSRILYERYRRGVYVFVDDYDAPIANVFVVLWRCFRRRDKHKSDAELFAEVCRSREFRYTVLLVENLIGHTLHRNEHLEQGILSGIFDVNLTASVTSSANSRNDIRYSLLESDFSPHHGFDEDEVDALLLPSDEWRSSSSFDRKAVRDWYAYNFLGNVVYNPYSITHFVANGYVLREYWHYEGRTPLTDDVVLTADSTQNVLHALTDGRTISRTNCSTELNFERPIKTDNPNLLLFAGYLNVMRPDYFTEQFALPNVEIRNIVTEKILRWLQRKLRIPAINFIALFRRLSALRMDDFEEKLRKHLSLIPSTTETSLRKTSRANDDTGNSRRQPVDDTAVYVNATMKCLIRSFEKFFTIQTCSNYSNGSDLAARGKTILLTSKPHARTSNGIIVKYSFAATADDLDKTAEIGLSEIAEATEGVKSRLPSYINQTLELSMAFYRRDVAMKYKITKL